MAIAVVCILALLGFSNVIRQETACCGADIRILFVELLFLDPLVFRPLPAYYHPGGRPSRRYGGPTLHAELPAMLTSSCLFAQIFQFQYQDERIQWECDNGGQQWNTTNANITFTDETATGTLLPTKFCDIGVRQTYLTFVFCLAVDFVLLCYGRFPPQPARRVPANAQE